MLTFQIQLDLQIRQLDIIQIVAAGTLTDILEHQILSIQPILLHILVGSGLIVIVHGAHFNAIHHQIDHVASVLIHTVFQTENMDLLNVKHVCGINTEVLILNAGTGVVCAQRQQVSGVLAEQEVHIVSIAGTAGQQHTVPVTAGLPFNDPFLIVLQFDLIFKLINNVVKYTLCDRTGQMLQGILRIAVGNNADHRIGLGIILPAVTLDLVRFIAITELAVTTQFALDSLPFTIDMAAQLCTFHLLGFATATSIGDRAGAATVCFQNLCRNEGMLMLCTVEPNLHIFRFPVLHIVVGSHTKELECQVLAIEPVIRLVLVCCRLEIVVQSADLDIINDQIDHIGAVFCQPVFQAEGMRSAHPAAYFRVVQTVVMEDRVQVCTNAQTKVLSAENNAHSAGTGLGC